MTSTSTPAVCEFSASIESTGAGLRIKGPKTRSGCRTITLSVGTIEILRDHRTATLETRLVLGLGRLPDEAFVFGNPDGSLRDPELLTHAWRQALTTLDLPRVTLHALDTRTPVR